MEEVSAKRILNFCWEPLSYELHLTTACIKSPYLKETPSEGEWNSERTTGTAPQELCVYAGITLPYELQLYFPTYNASVKLAI